MLSIARLLPRQLNQIGQCFSVSLKTSSCRSYFSPAYFGIDAFQRYSRNFEKEHGNNISQVKMTIEEALSKPESKVFTEDLKMLLYLAKTDQDIDLLINGIKKYQKQESAALFSFSFEPPLYRLLCSLDKTDKALELFLKEEENIINKYFKAGQMLMNKLLEDKRYNDVIKVANKIIKIYKSQLQKDPSTKLIPLDFSNLITEALLKKNNLEAFNEAKELIKQFNELQFEFHDSALLKVFSLAYKQGQYEIAYDLTSRFKRKSQVTVNNLKILALTKLKRYEEALNLTQEILNMEGFNKKFFKETFSCLEELAKNEGPKQQKYQEIIDSIKSGDMIFNLSLDEFALQLNENRKTNNLQQQRSQGFNRQGNQYQNRPQRFDSEGNQYQNRPQRFDSEGNQYQNRSQRFDREGNQYQNRSQGFDRQDNQYQSRPQSFDRQDNQFQNRPRFNKQNPNLRRNQNSEEE